MISQRNVSLGSLLIWAGIALGIVLLALAQLLDRAEFYGWGLALMGLACSYSIHRSMAVRDDLLRQAFDLGRQHERERGLSSIR